MKERSPIAVLLLSLFIPFYMLYWLYQTAKTLRERGATPPRLLLLVGPILLYLLFVVPFMLLRVVSVNSSVLNLIFTLVGVIAVVLMIVCPFIYYYRFSKASEQATNNKVSTTILFILFVLIGPVGSYLVQEALNTTASATPATPTTPDSAAPIAAVTPPVAPSVSSSPESPSPEPVIETNPMPPSQDPPKTV